MTTGYLHSVETCGTVDGPGLRYVAFLQGCPLRCAYCHNPDSWTSCCGEQKTAEALVEDVLRYKPFLRSGGLTLSGGEPLMQSEFVREVAQLCRRHRIHTAVDTSGAIPLHICRDAVLAADMLLLDIKHIDPEKCRSLTGQDNQHALELLDFCELHRKPVWVRHVVVPGLTDDLHDLERLARYLGRYSCIERIELLPFHKMGMHKWEQMNREWSLAETPEPSAELMTQIRNIFGKYHQAVA